MDPIDAIDPTAGALSGRTAARHLPDHDPVLKLSGRLCGGAPDKSLQSVAHDVLLNLNSPTNIQGKFREHSRNIQETFKEHSR